MPRDPNGNYTSPNSPVVAGTTVQAAYENSNTQDQATELTDSLSRSGKGAMLEALKVADDGTIFNTEQTTGLVRVGAGDAQFKVLGTNVFKWAQTAVSSLVKHLLTDSGVAFESEQNSGFVRNGAGDIRVEVLGRMTAVFQQDKLNGVYVAKIDKDGSLANVISGIGATLTRVHLYPEQWPVSGTLTIPSNVVIHAPRGATIDVPAGATLVAEGKVKFDGATFTNSGEFRGRLGGDNIKPGLWSDTRDNAAIQRALDFINNMYTTGSGTRSKPVLELEGEDYTISAQMTAPNNSLDLIGQGQTNLIVDSMPNATYVFNNFARSTKIQNIIIRDTTLSRTKWGWYFDRESNLNVEKCGGVGLARNFTFGFAHDWRGARGLMGYENDIDVLFTTPLPGAPSTETTSILFESCQFDNNRGSCVKSEVQLVNIHFLRCGLHPTNQPANARIVDLAGVSLNNVSFRACRFEAGNVGAVAGLVGIYASGPDSNFPSNLTLVDNYFTGVNVDTFIQLEGNNGVTVIERNFFLTEPTGQDIKINNTANQVKVTDDNSFGQTRTTKYVKLIEGAVPPPWYLRRQWNPVFIRVDRISLPATTTGQFSQTFRFDEQTRTPNMRMPTLTTRAELVFRSVVNDIKLAGEPGFSKLFNDECIIEYEVKNAAAGGAAEYDILLWGY